MVGNLFSFRSKPGCPSHDLFVYVNPFQAPVPRWRPQGHWISSTTRGHRHHPNSIIKPPNDSTSHLFRLVRQNRQRTVLNRSVSTENNGTHKPPNPPAPNIICSCYTLPRRPTVRQHLPRLQQPPLQPRHVDLLHAPAFLHRLARRRRRRLRQRHEHRLHPHRTVCHVARR